MDQIHPESAVAETRWPLLQIEPAHPETGSNLRLAFSVNIFPALQGGFFAQRQYLRNSINTEPCIEKTWNCRQKVADGVLHPAQMRGETGYPSSLSRLDSQ